MTDIPELNQSLTPGTLVSLFQLDTTNLGGPIFYFTSSAFESASIQFDGNTYTPVEIEAEGFELTGTGSIPQPVVRISNVNNAAGNAVNAYNDLVGAGFRRIRTYREFLDQGSSPDPTKKFNDDVYTVEQKTAHNKLFVEWKLSSRLDQEGRMLPGRQCLKNACTHTYRLFSTTLNDFNYNGVTCPYVGSLYWDQTNSEVTNPADDACSKQLRGCRLRFGENGELPTRSFPGMADVR